LSKELIVSGKAARPGGLAFAALFVAFSLFLLSQLGAQTTASPSSQLFSRPSFWPAVGVAGMTAFGVLHLFAERKNRHGGAKEALVWIRALEYLLWFMAYVWIVPVIGYLLATLAFAALLSVRVGYRTWPPVLGATALGFCVVLVFKAFLSVKIPGGAIYDALPEGIGNFMIVNF